MGHGRVYLYLYLFLIIHTVIIMIWEAILIFYFSFCMRFQEFQTNHMAHF